VVRQAGAAGRNPVSASTPQAHSGGCMAAKTTTKVKDLPRKAIDSKKAANVKGGMLAKPRKPSN